MVYIKGIGVLKRLNCELGREKDFENLKRIWEFEKAFKFEKPYV